MATNPTTAAKGGNTEVRVLRHHEDFVPNQVISLSADEAKAAKEGGWADPDPAAVAWAKANEPQPEAQS
jgi:hypothetical protein